MSTRFVLPATATVADIDELGHVSNQVYLRWVLDVAVAHSNSVGWDATRYRTFGASFVVRRHELDYLAPVVEGEALSLQTWVETWKQASCIRRTEILRGDKAVLRAATTWAFMSLTSGRPMRIPDDIHALFATPT